MQSTGVSSCPFVHMSSCPWTNDTLLAKLFTVVETILPTERPRHLHTVWSKSSTAQSNGISVSHLCLRKNCLFSFKSRVYQMYQSSLRSSPADIENTDYIENQMQPFKSSNLRTFLCTNSKYSAVQNRSLYGAQG